MTAINRRAGLMLALATIAILGVLCVHGLDAGPLDSTGMTTAHAHEGTTAHEVIGLCVFTVTMTALGASVIPAARRPRLTTLVPRAFRQSVPPVRFVHGKLRLFDLCVIRV